MPTIMRCCFLSGAAADRTPVPIDARKSSALRFPNADASNLAVLGDMHDYIVRALWQRGDTPDEGQVWERLSVVVVEQLGVRPDEVRRTAHIVS